MAGLKQYESTDVTRSQNRPGAVSRGVFRGQGWSPNNAGQGQSGARGASGGGPWAKQAGRAPALPRK